MSYDFYNFSAGPEKEENTIKNINTTTKEGKYLLAALAILTTSTFVFKGDEINGGGLTPDSILKKLEIISNEMFGTGGE